MFDRDKKLEQEEYMGSFGEYWARCRILLHQYQIKLLKYVLDATDLLRLYALVIDMFSSWQQQNKTQLSQICGKKLYWDKRIQVIYMKCKYLSDSCYQHLVVNNFLYLQATEEFVLPTHSNNQYMQG